MSDERRPNSVSGLPAGTLPTLPARIGLLPPPSLQSKQIDSLHLRNERFLPALASLPSPTAHLGIAAATAASLASTNDMLQALKQKAVDRSAQHRQGRSKSVPKSEGSSRADSGRIRQGRAQLPLRRPQKMEPEELSRKLAARLQPLEQVTNSILAAVEERRGGGAAPLAKATCKDFVVGRATCAASSVVTLFSDRLEYKFSHPTQGRIDMVMYTKDMTAPELNLRTAMLKFRISKPLRHFIDTYDCTDPQHVLILTFHDKADATQFEELLVSNCKVLLRVVGEQ